MGEQNPPSFGYNSTVAALPRGQSKKTLERGLKPTSFPLAISWSPIQVISNLLTSNLIPLYN